MSKELTPLGNTFLKLSNLKLGNKMTVRLFKSHISAQSI